MKASIKAAVCFLLLLVGRLGVWADENRIWVDAQINGTNVHLIWDTGAGRGLVLFRAAAAKLGLTITNPPADVSLLPGEIALGATSEFELSVFSSKLKTFASVIDLPSVLPTRADGLLGWPSIRDNRLLMDVLARKVEPVATLPGDIKSWLKVGVATNADKLNLEVPGKGGERCVISIDTGSERGMELSAERWQKWRSAHPRQPSTFTAYWTPAPGLVVREECFAKEVVLGLLVLNSVPVMEANSMETATPGFAATLGMAALRRLELIVDRANGVAYVRLKKTKPLPYEHNRLGAVFTPVTMESDDLLAHVAADSPASRAGIRNGDKLLMIDELDVTNWRTDRRVMPLSRFWSQPAQTSLKLRLEHGSDPYSVQVKLQDILVP